MIEGIVFGLLAAACQSLSFLFSRIFVTKPGNRPTTLFVLSHAIMGVFALALLPLVWSDRARDLGSYLWPLIGATGFYLFGQTWIFHAMRRTDASRVVPLLGMKLLILAIITVLFFRQPLTPLQWLSVLLTVAAAFALNYSGGGLMPGVAVLAILVGCVGYSLSDLSIVALTRVLAPDGSLRGAMLCVCLSYILSGALSLVLLAAMRPEDRAPEKWKDALPMAVAWFLAMIFLYVCFQHIGAVFGNIVQSLRGPLSILLGSFIASLGHLHVEQRIGRATLIRRLAASLLMCLAIFLFVRERARLQEQHRPPAAPAVSQPAECEKRLP